MSTRGGVDREVDAEALPAAFGQERREELAVVVRRHGLLDEADAALVEEPRSLSLRIDDHEAALVELEMALDQRQHAFADRAEADHHDRAGDAAVDGPSGHRICLLTKAATVKGKHRITVSGASRIAEPPGSMPGTRFPRRHGNFPADGEACMTIAAQPCRFHARHRETRLHDGGPLRFSSGRER